MEVFLATPEKTIFKSDQAESVKLKAFQGELEILPKHANLIALTKAGALQVKLSSGKTESFQIGDGVLKVEDGKVNLLCR